MREYRKHKYISPYFHAQARGEIGRKKRDEIYPIYKAKEYPRFVEHTLGPGIEVNCSLTGGLVERRTRREFESTEALLLSDIETLLSSGLKIQNGEEISEDVEPKRPYPSGGSRNPLECYVWVLREKDIPSGLYYYNPIRHSLITLLEGNQLLSRDRILTYSFSKDAPVLFFFTAKWERTLLKYGDLGYAFAHLECGHASQNLLLLAEALKLSACPLAGFRFKETCELLGIDGIDEAPIHAIAFGKRL